MQKPDIEITDTRTGYEMRLTTNNGRTIRVFLSKTKKNNSKIYLLFFIFGWCLNNDMKIKDVIQLLGKARKILEK